jgi:hypothetical protein
MPRLSILSPCENVILGQDNNASIIVIIHQVRMQLPPDVPDPIPPGSVSPMTWYVFAQWEILPGEVGQHFEQ